MSVVPASIPSSAAEGLKALVSRYAISLHIWPSYSSLHNERVQVGFELELMGSHCLDPTHIDPGCPNCHLVRDVLGRIAESLLCSISTNGDPPLFCEITHPNSIVCLPRSGNRPVVTLSLNIQSPRQQGVTPQDVARVNELKHRLSELGIRER